MTEPVHVLAVHVLAVHVECRRCGQFGRLEQNHPDSFTQRVLQPLASFWTSHRDPKLVLVEVIANGEPQEWVASDSPQIRTDERSIAMNNLNPALDDVSDADELAGDPVTPEHDLDPTTFAQESDDE